MGSLNIPAGALVYLDTNAVIYSIETDPIFWPILKPVWESAARGAISLFSSELTILETMVAPMKKGDQVLVAAYEQLFRSPDLQLTSITREVLRRAGRLRATTPGLRTPDAIHAASAIERGCTSFVTNDAGFKRVSGLPLAVLSDFIGP